jgi:hypothetical protein
MILETMHQFLRQRARSCEDKPAALAWTHLAMCATRPHRLRHAQCILSKIYRMPRVEIAQPGHYHLALVAVMRNEDAYVKDWLSFHLAQGVSHFFLYDNEPNDEAAGRTRALIEPFITKGLVSYLRWPPVDGCRIGCRQNTDRSINSIQEIEYFDFKKRFGAWCEYYAKLDIDEFLFNVDRRPLTARLNFHGSAVVKGFDFGSSGHQQFEDAPVWRRFVRRAREPRQIKSIARTHDVYEYFNAHLMLEKPSLYMRLPEHVVREGKEEFLNYVRLHHYKTKSREEFIARRLGDCGYTTGNYQESDFDLLDAELNEVEDLILAEYNASNVSYMA